MKERNLTVPVTVHIPVADLEEIEATAHTLGVSRAGFAKQALKREVARAKLALKTEPEAVR